MSWFSGNSVSTVELDNKISEATSESIPNGEIELSVALEITDLIRSKKIPPKQCMRSLKKRLTLVHANPNLLTSSLRLVDLCVKNSGFHFLVEIASKEFMDYMVDVLLKIHYNVKDYAVRDVESKKNVGNTLLGLIHEWTIMFENQLQLNYVEKCYRQLVNEGYQFPPKEGTSHVNSTFIDSEAPPDWVDNDSCMICYTPFSMINRKHHCRACGGVFCQAHSNNYIPLVSLGIKEPVRVCDNCHAKYKGKTPKAPGHASHSRSRSAASAPPDDEDEEFKRAIEMSLRESGQQEFRPPAEPPKPEPRPQTQNDDEEDEEMKAAIAASLKEFENQEKHYKQTQIQQPPAPSAPQSDFYSNILPFDANEQFGSTAYQGYGNDPNRANEYSRPPPQQRAQQEQLQPQKTQVEDLTQQEESQINLFITLMNTVKNDPKKRANVLYDSNLSELHSQVIRLKPKVNKSLRASIERYETFLEMNNKISTIIKLYDQFLEDKLNMAYGNHHVSSHHGVEDTAPQFFSETSYQNKTAGHHRPNFNAYAPQSTFQETLGHQASSTSGEAHPQPGHVSQQPTGYGFQDPVTRQSTGYPHNAPVSSQSTGYPAAEYPANAFQQPSEPNFDEDEETEPEQPTYAYGQAPPPTTFGGAPAASATAPLAYPVSYDGVSSQPPAHSQPGPYPPTNYSPEITDNETDNERVDSAGLSAQQPVSTQVRRQSSTLPPHAVEDATARFPTIEAVEEDYNNNNNNHPNRAPYPDSTRMPDMPDLPNPPSFDRSKPQATPYVAEPEPLIEL